MQGAATSFTISNMTVAMQTRNYRLNDSGAFSVLVVPLVLVSILLIVSVGFGVWAYSSRGDYKNKSDQKSAVAVAQAIKQEDIVKDKQHAEADKQPLKTYIGPEQYGGLHLSYPKTWSGYINGAGTSAQPLDSYFQPDVVPSISNQNAPFALRAQIMNQSYSSVISQYNGGITAKTLTAKPYSYPKVPSVVGIRFDGIVDGGKKATGAIVVVPLRDKTLKIWTENQAYLADFNNSVLPNVTFSP